jgi:thioesterase domain-containing protein
MYENSVASQIITLWQDLLGKFELSENCDFYQHHGDDLLFAVLKQKIKNIFGVTLPHEQNPNLTRLPDQIKYIRNITTMGKTIVPFKNSGNISDIILFTHPFGGSLFCYNKIIESIKSQYGIWGIQDSFLFSIFKHYANINAQGKQYAKAVLQQFDIKNIVLIGYSYGASLAYEIAYNLDLAGISIKNLIMLDGWLDITPDQGLIDQFTAIINREIERVQLYSFFDSETDFNTWRSLLLKRMQIALYYIPTGKSTFPITLFVPQEFGKEYVASKNCANNWGQYSNKIEVYPISGNHEHLLNSQNINTINQKIKLIMELIENKANA